MRSRQRGFTDGAAFVFCAVIVVLIAGGWVANIVKLVGLVDGSVTGMFVLRAVGIVVAPLGVILGYC
jgi:hypothetical protein